MALTPAEPNCLRTISSSGEDSSEEDGEFEISRLMIEVLGGSVSIGSSAQTMRCITISLPAD